MLNLLVEGALLAFGFAMMPLLDSAKPPVPASDETTVRVGAGKPFHDESVANYGGNRPNIALFDVAGYDLGWEEGGTKLQAGDYHDYTIKMPANNRGQAEYISVSSAGNDGICIAYVTVNWPGDTGSRTWYGDYAADCGGSWYHSHVITNDDGTKPKCAWIDGDATNAHTTKGFGIHITDFGLTDELWEQWKSHNETLCESQPRFHMYEGLELKHWLPVFDPPLEYNDDRTDIDFSKVLVSGAHRGVSPPRNSNARRVKRNGPPPERFSGQLVTSTDPRQSAHELCTSGNASGPDFVSFPEGLFCDMSEKQLWPLCVERLQNGCFDVDTTTMRRGTGLQGRDEASGRAIPEKSYKKVQSWD